MTRPFIIFFAAIVCTLSCKNQGDDEKPAGKLQGLHKYYFPDGKIYLEVNYKDSVPHGTTKRYYKAGGLLEEAEYRNGVLHGVSKTYYEDGRLSTETPYDSGRIHGIKRKFRKDGSPAYEAPYHFDEPAVGLKEWYLSGRPIDNYPKIVVKPKNELLKESKYTLEITLSDESRAVEFFHGPLKTKYLTSENRAIYTYQGVGRLFYFLPPGAFAMEEVKVIAKIKTDLGNYYLSETSYHLAVENR